MKNFIKNLLCMQVFTNPLHDVTPNTNKTTDTGAGTANYGYDHYYGLSAEMKTFYDKNLIDLASPKLIHAQFAEKKPIPEGNGKTIEFRRYSPLPEITTPLQEGVTPDGQKLNVTAITATVGQYGNYVELTDMLIMTAIDNNILVASKKLADQASLLADKIDRNALLTGTNFLFPDDATTRATVGKTNGNTYLITVPLIYEAVRKLKSVDAPQIDGMYACIIHPDVAKDLMLDNDWKDMHKYCRPEEMYNGYIGEVAGVRFYESTNAKVVRGENLAGATRTLAVNKTGGYSTGATSIVFDGGTVVADALIGKLIVIGDYTYEVADNTTTTITLKSGLLASVADDAVIYPEGDNKGEAVYPCFFLGEGAFATTEIEGGGIQHIAKPLGAGEDALNQRSTVGWKMTRVAEMLIPEYCVELDVKSTNSAYAKGN